MVVCRELVRHLGALKNNEKSSRLNRSKSFVVAGEKFELGKPVFVEEDNQEDYAQNVHYDP